MKCLECARGVEKIDAIPEDVRPDGTMPTYGTCRRCRQARGNSRRGVAGLSRLSAPEMALYRHEVDRRAVRVPERTPAGSGMGTER